MDALRLAFPKGCQVRLSAMGKLVARHRRELRSGQVTGYGHDDGTVLVLWTGYGYSQRWHRDYVERV